MTSTSQKILCLAEDPVELIQILAVARLPDLADKISCTQVAPKMPSCEAWSHRKATVLQAEILDPKGVLRSCQQYVLILEADALVWGVLQNGKNQWTSSIVLNLRRGRWTNLVPNNVRFNKIWTTHIKEAAHLLDWVKFSTNEPLWSIPAFRLQ